MTDFILKLDVDQIENTLVRIFSRNPEKSHLWLIEQVAKIESISKDDAKMVFVRALHRQHIAVDTRTMKFFVPKENIISGK